MRSVRIGRIAEHWQALNLLECLAGLVDFLCLPMRVSEVCLDVPQWVRRRCVRDRRCGGLGSNRLELFSQSADLFSGTRIGERLFGHITKSFGFLLAPVLKLL